VHEKVNNKIENWSRILSDFRYRFFIADLYTHFDSLEGKRGMRVIELEYLIYFPATLNKPYAVLGGRVISGIS